MWRALEDALNELSDNDLGWWPFLFMRPRPHERMSERRVLALSALYALPVGLFGAIAIRNAYADPHPHPLLIPPLAVLVFFTFFRATLAWAWNRRAARLKLDTERLEKLRSAFDEDPSAD
jgi:hypothetical protein